MRKYAIFPLYFPQRRCTSACELCCVWEAPESVPVSLDPAGLGAQLEAFLLERSTGPAARRELGLFGGPLALARGELERFLAPAKELVARGRLDGIRIQARPDQIEDATLEWLTRWSVDTVELEVPSLTEAVLCRFSVLHAPCRVRHVAEQVRARGLKLGLQLRLGLPGSTWGLEMRTIERAVALRPGFVRLYPELVLRGSPLERALQQGKYVPQPLEEMVRLCAVALERLEHYEIPVARMGLQPVRDLQLPSGCVVAGPYHPALRTLVQTRRLYERADRLLRGARAAGRALTLKVYPGDESALRGPENAALRQLQRRHRLQVLSIESDASLNPGEIGLEGSGQTPGWTPRLIRQKAD